MADVSRGSGQLIKKWMRSGGVIPQEAIDELEEGTKGGKILEFVTRGDEGATSGVRLSVQAPSDDDDYCGTMANWFIRWKRRYPQVPARLIYFPYGIPELDTIIAELRLGQIEQPRV
jgi:hypothetical protein